MYISKLKSLVNPSPQKNGIQKRMEVGRSTFGKDYIMNGNLPLPEEVFN